MKMEMLAIKTRSKVNVYLIDDPEIRKLKKKYFNQDRATDVISFPVEWANLKNCVRDMKDKEIDFNLTGEIAISLDTAISQAKERCVPIYSELLLLIVHGLLHLNGYLDEKQNDWKKMKIAEFETMMRIL